MKKKIFLATLLVCVCVTMFGCESKTEKLVQKNMSEITQTYFYGDGETFSASVSSGVREESYLMDGKSGNNVDFALVAVDLKSSQTTRFLTIVVTVDGFKQEVEAEINTLGTSYLFDLGKKMTGEEVVIVEVNGEILHLQRVDFEIDGQNAIEIASKALEDKILLKKKFNNLNAECYLKILDKDVNKLDNFYWCFMIVNVDGETFSAIISTQDGSILAQN